MERLTTVVVLTMLGVAVGACSGPAAQTCISWVRYEDDAARTEAADVVIEAGERLDVASTPRTCEGDRIYPDGDPLDTDGSLRLYLVDSDFAIEGTETGLALITPFDGAAPAGSSAPEGSSSREP